MDWECLKDMSKCSGESCSLFMYPKDCSINSVAISLRAITAALEEISDTLKRKEK